MNPAAVGGLLRPNYMQMQRIEKCRAISGVAR
jgi:hypothetical protein